jgi:drug/metabolite transporter (DMT)-like permease
MSGALLAVISAVGFGLFQAFNRRGAHKIDIFWATYLLIITSSLVLVLITISTQSFSSLFSAPSDAIINFGVAGFIHFFIGWTLLSLSQKRVGAARTGAITGATPLFATIIAYVTLDEIPSLMSILGIILVVSGAITIMSEHKTGFTQPSLQKNSSTLNWLDWSMGFGTALCWAVSPIFIRRGLYSLSSPLVGVTIGMITNAVAYTLLLLLRRKGLNCALLSREQLFFQLSAGLLVGLAMWARWEAFKSESVAVVTALGRLNIPLVILLSPLVVGQKYERVSLQVWLGGTLIVAGSLLLILV